MIAVGVDPGSAMGVVALELTRPGQLAGGRWLDHAVITPAAAPPGPLRDRGFCTRLIEWLTHHSPALIVLEEPLDARPYWGGARKNFQEAGTGSGFRSGAHYGIAVAATLAIAGVEVASYPVGNFEGRPGWMGGGKGRRDKAIGRSATLARHLGAPASVFALKPDGAYRHDHLFMALGVLAFHLSQAPIRRALKAAASPIAELEGLAPVLR